jgi:hypothetical protein
MLRGSFMICLLELRIADVCLAVLAPVFWLSRQLVCVYENVEESNLLSTSSIQTSCLLVRSLPLVALEVWCGSKFWDTVQAIKSSDNYLRALTAHATGSWEAIEVHQIII